jgi:hypothetical protein
MLGPIGSELMSIFRLLSPEEIDKYVVNKTVRKVAGSMAAGGESMEFNTEDSNLGEFQKEKFNKEKKAKIIPISDYQEEEATPDKKAKHSFTEEKIATVEQFPINKKLETTKERKPSHGNSDLESIGVLSANTIKDIESQRLAEENSQKDSTTVFLLKQRQIMRDSKKKMIEQQAHKQYKTNAAQEFYVQTEEDILSEEPQQDASKGILVNKKQY